MKQLLKISCGIILLYSLSFKIYAQDSAKVVAVRSAFATSYIFEKSWQYATAITRLKNVYDEKSYEINLRLGYLYYKSAYYRESEHYYKKAVELKPSSIEAKLGYVLPLGALASWDTVKMQYEAILKLDPNNSTVNYRMGLIYYYKADYTSALSYFQKVLFSYPFDYYNTLMSAWANVRLKKNAEARSLFNTVMLIQPGDTSSLRGLRMIK